eukprot:CAMPEP_0113718940 /NCGR_PEP_ID=MMETSP0038_2-20120614/35498_1 /TAXON_ID=2898 /ORGANISM="Cryptomonas paramecium" /LENGTH=58 /DNA_ID=CAMNT_0000647177 /DNA_START=171 /DNA_END=344 /DNA_ORIENTATION=- /assembly_acc=CAM_ASM_000170
MTLSGIPARLDNAGQIPAGNPIRSEAPPARPQNPYDGYPQQANHTARRLPPGLSAVPI